MSIIQDWYGDPCTPEIDLIEMYERDYARFLVNRETLETIKVVFNQSLEHDFKQGGFVGLIRFPGIIQ